MLEHVPELFQWHQRLLCTFNRLLNVKLSLGEMWGNGEQSVGRVLVLADGEAPCCLLTPSVPPLTLKTHIDALLTKVKSQIGFLYQNKSLFTHSAKQLLVKLTEISIFDHDNIICRSASKTLLH